MNNTINIPNLITGFRFFFFLCFIYAASQNNFYALLAFFLLAWSLDVFDGFVARQLKQETNFGNILDKAIDRTILIGAVIILIRFEFLPPLALLILTKEIASLPVISLQLKNPSLIRSAGKSGKVMAGLQGAAIVWGLLQLPLFTFLVYLVAILGGSVGGWYTHKCFRNN